MKKFLYSLFFAGAAIPTLLAQTIVTTTPQYKSTVLEEYTGIHCQYCPDGHVRAKELKADFPGRVVLVNIHQGGYAVPSGSEPDFRTLWGNSLAAQTGLTGYPTGTINRRIFPDLGTAMAISRSQWRIAAAEVMEEVSPVNLGATTSYNSATRQLTINVEAYYTANGTSSYNLLNIALIEDSIPGPQTGASTWNPGDILPNGKYKHDHMLRDLITGQWGDTIPSTTQGSLYSKTFTYTIPNDVNGIGINPSQCHLALYITESRTNVLQGITVDVSNGNNDGNVAPYYGSFSNLNSSILEGNSSAASTFTFEIVPTVSGNFEFDLTSNAPADWSASYSVNGTVYTGKNSISLSSGTTAFVHINASPGATNDLAEYTLTANPVTDPGSTITQKVYVIKGITDLVVNGSGAFGNGGSYNWSQLYLDGLVQAGNTAHDATSASIMAEGIANNAFGGVSNLYLNIGWTFPAFTDNEANALMDFMDNGGNILVAGQDIGWAINTSPGSGGYMTPTTLDLYNNYFKATYLADGNGANNQLTSISSDIIFQSVPNSAIQDAYNGFFYPDEISPKAGASAIFNYNGDTSEVAGIRADNGTYKVVYLGVGLEMITDVNAKNIILGKSHDWFHNLISVEEFDAAMKNLQVYPNPSHGEVNLTVAENGNYEISVKNMTGQEVYKTSTDAGNQQLRIQLGHLPAGPYMINISNDKKVYSGKVVLE